MGDNKRAQLKLGDKVPNFSAESTKGSITWHEYIQGSWAILFSHPADYTPVCTTELGEVANIMNEFDKRGVKVAALSCDPVEKHKGWIKDIEGSRWCNVELGFPIIADEKRNVAELYGMLDPDEKDSQGLPLTCRAVFIVDDEKRLKASILYPATTGRNFDEILRVIDSLQLTKKYNVATPVNWRPGKDCMLQPSVSEGEAKEKYGGFRLENLPSNKQYIRYVRDPSGHVRVNPDVFKVGISFFAGILGTLSTINYYESGGIFGERKPATTTTTTGPAKRRRRTGDSL